MTWSDKKNLKALGNQNNFSASFWAGAGRWFGDHHSILLQLYQLSTAGNCRVLPWGFSNAALLSTGSSPVASTCCPSMWQAQSIQVTASKCWEIMKIVFTGTHQHHMWSCGTLTSRVHTTSLCSQIPFDFFSRLNRTSWQRYKNPLLKKQQRVGREGCRVLSPASWQMVFIPHWQITLCFQATKRERPRIVWHGCDVLWNQASLASTLGTQVGHGVGESVGHHGTSRSRHLLCNLAVLILANIMEKKTFSVSLQMFIHCPKD